MATQSERSGTECRTAQLDSLCGMVADAARLQESGRLDHAVTRWARELSTPAEVILLVEQARRETRASRRRDEVLERIAVTAVTAVGDRLVREALTDPLTGLASRARMEDEVQHLLALSLRNGKPLTAVILDVDGLKRLNDTEGHAAGDEALAEVGRAVREHLRKTDRAYRWGGDEFLLLMTTGLDDSSLVVERIRQSCATPVSYGAAVHSGGSDSADVSTWLSEADADLYRRRHQDRTVLPVPRRTSHVHPARQLALGGLAAAAAVTVGWAGVTAAVSGSGHKGSPAQVAAAPALGSVLTPTVSPPAPVSVAPAKAVRASRSRSGSKPAGRSTPAVVVPAVQVQLPGVQLPPVATPPVVVPVPVQPSDAPTGLVPGLLHAVRGVVQALLPA